jgi:hypothetical protein
MNFKFFIFLLATLILHPVLVVAEQPSEYQKLLELSKLNDSKIKIQSDENIAEIKAQAEKNIAGINAQAEKNALAIKSQK